MSDLNSIYSSLDTTSIVNIAASTISGNGLSSNIYNSGGIYNGVYNGVYNGIYTGAGGAYTSDYFSPKTPRYNPLSLLEYFVEFELDDKQLLEGNLKSIKNNKFIFNCNYVGNRIQPYEYIMNLIENKTKFSVKVKVSNVLTICYTGLQFTKIQNNLSFSGNCDFSELKVKIKYDSILYQNHKLSEKELRTDKLKKIINNSEL